MATALLRCLALTLEGSTDLRSTGDAAPVRGAVLLPHVSYCLTMFHITAMLGAAFIDAMNVIPSKLTALHSTKEGAVMAKQWRGAGDQAFGMPRAVYEKTPYDEARPAATYRPAARLRSQQKCYVCGSFMPIGTTGVTYSTRRRCWRHIGCPSDQAPRV